MRSTMSALVMVIGTGASSSELQLEAAAQPLEHGGVPGIDLVVGKGAVRSAVGDGVGQALLAARHRRPTIAIEQPHRFDVDVTERAHFLDDLPGPKAFVDDHGDVTGNGRKTR